MGDQYPELQSGNEQIAKIILKKKLLFLKLLAKG